MATFSSTVSVGSSFTCWNVRLIPWRAIRCGSIRPTSWPTKRTLPELAGTTPEIRLNIVLLPAPFGPSRPRISPARTCRLTPPTATSPPKRLVASVTSSSVAPYAGCSRRGSGAAAASGCSGFGTVPSLRQRPASFGHSPSGARCSSTMVSSDSTIAS